MGCETQYTIDSVHRDFLAQWVGHGGKGQREKGLSFERACNMKVTPFANYSPVILLSERTEFHGHVRFEDFYGEQ